MVWEDIKQRSLADTMIVTYKAVKELDEFNKLIDWLRIEQYLLSMHAKPRGEKA